MKVLIVTVALVAFSVAIPKPSKLYYRNLYKPVKNYLKSNSRIIGGQNAIPHSIPYQIFLEVYSLNEGWYCGGSLISQNYVLTAGHCGQDAIQAQVILGAHRSLQTEDTQVFLVSGDIMVHQDYNSDSVTNDIAVIRLPDTVSLNNAIQTIALPNLSEAKNTYEAEIARISGWGLTDGYGIELSDVLKYVDVRVISNTDCESVYGNIPSSVICTSGDDGTGSCGGDSGGPLVANNQQIGIVSFGAMDCEAGAPSAFTRITSFLDWIADHTDVVIY